MQAYRRFSFGFIVVISLFSSCKRATPAQREYRAIENAHTLRADTAAQYSEELSMQPYLEDPKTRKELVEIVIEKMHVQHANGNKVLQWLFGIDADKKNIPIHAYLRQISSTIKQLKNQQRELSKHAVQSTADSYLALQELVAQLTSIEKAVRMNSEYRTEQRFIIERDGREAAAREMRAMNEKLDKLTKVKTR